MRSPTAASLAVVTCTDDDTVFQLRTLISFFGDTWCHLAGTFYAGWCLQSHADCTDRLAIRDFGGGPRAE